MVEVSGNEEILSGRHTQALRRPLFRLGRRPLLHRADGGTESGR